MDRAAERPVAEPRRMEPRATATFVPYYWEAYNEIVEPRRINHYLIRRWLPELGSLGFAVIQVLRDRCYHNPATGVLRNQCEIDADELAHALAVGRATLFRELTRNEALGHFLQRVEQYQIVNGRPQQAKNLWRVSMDDPIHPADMVRYDDLRAIKEMERQRQAQEQQSRAGGGKQRKQLRQAPGPFESQIETQRVSARLYESQFETPDTKCLQAQNETPETSSLPSQSETAKEESLPSGDLSTEESLTPAAAAPQPNGFPTGGEGSTAPPELLAAWPLALKEIAEVVNPPTYHTHIARLLPVDLTDGGEVALLVPSAFTRSWLEARHLPTIERALAKALDRPVTLRLTQMAPENGASLERNSI